jgi:hypothetical protein
MKTGSSGHWGLYSKYFIKISSIPGKPSKFGFLLTYWGPFVS